MQTIAIYRGISFVYSELVAEVECPIVPRVGETISLTDPGDQATESVAEVNHLITDQGVQIRVRVSPIASRASRLRQSRST